MAPYLLRGIRRRMRSARFACGLVCAVEASALVGCEVQPPPPPRWNAQLTSPTR